MKGLQGSLLLGAAWLLIGTGVASAWHVEGRVVCEGTLEPLGGVTVRAVSTDAGPPFTGTSITDAGGAYFIELPNFAQCFNVRVILGPGESPVTPPSGTFAFCTTDLDFVHEFDFVVASPRCDDVPPPPEEGRCWLTGGGNRFISITGTNMGESANKHNWGGNVNPGCSPTAGDGGSWNHVAHSQKLHFQGQSITVVRCGNEIGIPPGSESPETPFNFIEFTGSGRMVGIKGNKASYPLVYFFARCEDRNEPGSSGVNDGALKDRYFLHVYSNPSNPAGSTLLLVDIDRDPTTVDPLAILHGNLQLHISSCDSPAPTGGLRSKSMGEQSGAGTGLASGAIQLEAPDPNPTDTYARLRFQLPRATEVSVAVYDVAGRTIQHLESGSLPPGEHTIPWDLTNLDGERVARGVYFVRLAAEGGTWSRPIVVR